jgi:hypothetical protein
MEAPDSIFLSGLALRNLVARNTPRAPGVLQEPSSAGKTGLPEAVTMATEAFENP